MTNQRVKIISNETINIPKTIYNNKFFSVIIISFSVVLGSETIVLVSKVVEVSVGFEIIFSCVVRVCFDLILVKKTSSLTEFMEFI
jgi:hypothetical protein